MKLYLVQRTSDFDYDQTHAMVIASNTEEEAINVWNERSISYTATNKFKITYIAPDSIYDTVTVVLEDYNAG